MTIIKATLTLEGTKDLTDAQIEHICQVLEEAGMLDKLYGAAREMCREHLGELAHRVAVFLE